MNLASNLSNHQMNSRRRRLNTLMRVSASSLDKDVHYYLNNGLGSIVLLVATGVAPLANIAKTAPLYELFWSSYIGPKALNLSMTLHHWVNEGLMALFFFSVGLEIKGVYPWKFIKFETSHLTVFGAVGGIPLVPMLFYLVFNLASSNGVMAGWAIPMATDIAFAMGIYGFFKNKMPNGVAAFLLTLATVDASFGAILVIAIFSSKTLIKEYVFLAIAVSGVTFSACKRKVTNIKVYMSLFVLLWYFLLQQNQR